MDGKTGTDVLLWNGVPGLSNDTEVSLFQKMSRWNNLNYDCGLRSGMLDGSNFRAVLLQRKYWHSFRAW
ncbi:hypothetical protein PISMIDRAFT_676378 [Pisolithus microcarpus 441]|uniref:Uncharacterized protein n=1 Tax=Pisolithus microcarpus 441 TaxID=765257 RepID=A0A0C9YMI2_9AGAM|nr:hypothetical protein PISMIDRAFT_676378 [Pisolithus microcarpus 441]